MLHRVIRFSLATVAMTACVTPSASPIDPIADAGSLAPGHHGGAVAWRPWEPASFAQAKAEKRLLLVTIVTEWCHWCHVMDEKTWDDPAIAALMNERFITIRVDADARPDLAERYADWGWPALALLTPDAQPVTEWKGYQEARRFESELESYLEDLDAGRPLARKAAVIDQSRAPLAAMRDFTRTQLDRFYDPIEGGWGKTQKYPLWAPIAAGLFAGMSRGDDAALAEVKKTLDGELALIDAVDGGMFQYSLKGVWTAPHYEKLAEIQGPGMENLADAWAVLHDDRYRTGAEDIARYVLTVLKRGDGAFYANQDADVGTRGEVTRVLGSEWYALATREERAARGEPFIDRHVYASHNGRLITGLARLGLLTGQRDLIKAASDAAEVIIANHKVGDGFSHDEGTLDDGVLHLADQIGMGQALLTLSEATGDARYRALAVATARFVVSNLEDHDVGGYYAHTPVPGDVGVFAERRKPYKVNGEAARFVLKVGRLEEDAALITSAERALGVFAVQDVVAAEFRAVGEMLLAIEEQLTEPLHFSIVGGDDDATRALLAATNAVYAPYRLVDIQAPGKKYPDLGKPALYICGSTFCSAPITDPAKVATKAATFLKPKPKPKP